MILSKLSPIGSKGRKFFWPSCSTHTDPLVCCSCLMQELERARERSLAKCSYSHHQNGGCLQERGESGRPQAAVRRSQGLTHSRGWQGFGQAPLPFGQRGSETLRLPKGKPSGSPRRHFAPLSPASGPLTWESKPVSFIFVASCEKQSDFFSYWAFLNRDKLRWKSVLLENRSYNPPCYKGWS